MRKRNIRSTVQARRSSLRFHLFCWGPTVSGKAYQLPSGEIIPVPEPTTWALLGASIAAIPFMRRKRA